MFKRYLTLGGVCALAASASFAQTTVPLDSWGFLTNYGPGTGSGFNSTSPTFNAIDGGNMAFAVKFPSRDMKDVEDYVTATFNLTVDGGITGGSFRIGIFSDNGALSAPAGDPAVLDGATDGFIGYLWCLSAGSDAPGSSDPDGGDAGTGTIVGKNVSGNWLSTYNGYSVVKDPYFGPAEGSPGSGSYDVTVDLYRTSATTIELGLTFSEVGGTWEWKDQFRVDDEEVAAALQSVNVIAFADLGVGADMWAITGGEVEGEAGEDPVGGSKWLDTYDVGADGWASTGTWLGWVWVDNSPWVYSYSLNHYIYVSEGSYTESGAWIYAPKPAAE